MSQAAARSSQPAAAGAGTIPRVSRVAIAPNAGITIPGTFCRAHTREHLTRRVHVGDGRQLPVDHHARKLRPEPPGDGDT